MAGWLSRATAAFTTKTPPAPEPFDVRCDCGGRVTGERTRSSQKPSCPSCGRAIFVLPANVYPRTAKPSAKKTTPKAPPGKQSASDRQSPQKSAALKTAAAATAVPSTKPVTGIELDSRVKLVTPFRLIVVAMVFVSGLTGWGLWYRHRVELAKTIVAKSIEVGMQALKERDFPTAAHELERARDAVDLLKRTDAESETVRRMCREAVAARGLSFESLLGLLHDSLKDVKPGDKESVQFNSLYRGSWVLFDCDVRMPDDAKQPCVLDMPVFHRGRAIHIEVNFAALRKLVASIPDGEPPRVIFAAQLTKLTLGENDQSPVVVTLNGDTAFLWTSHENLTALGHHDFNDEEVKATRAVLARQLESMGGAK